MSEQDRALWNARHAERPADFRPSASLLELGERLGPPRPGALALDLACGTGRNSVYLAELGYRVDAWDLSNVGLAILESELDRRNESGQPREVTPRWVDLDSVEIPADRYDLVIDYYFLNRRLFPALESALRPGGILVLQTFLDAGRSRQRIANRAHLLAPGELSAAFTSLRTLEYVEDPDEGLARLVARRQTPGMES